MNKLVSGIVLSVLALAMFSCGDRSGHPGYEFAPNMYVSEPLDPLTQAKNAEFPYNKNNMTMREPVEGTVARGKMPYRIHMDSLDAAAKIPNPVKLTDDVLAEGEALYGRFCAHCHGAGGKGDGLVGKKYTGVANLLGRAYKDKSMGHIFHVITKGKGRMNSHASQLSPDERWKIAHYVKKLQNQE